MTTLHISTFDTLYALEIDEASRGASSIAIDRVGAFDIGADVHDIGFADWGALFALSDGFGERRSRVLSEVDLTDGQAIYGHTTWSAWGNDAVVADLDGDGLSELIVSDYFARDDTTDTYPGLICAWTLPVVTTDAPSYAPYRDIPGLEFCELEPAAIHAAIDAALAGPRPSRDSLAKSPFQIDRAAWLDQLLEGERP